MTNLTKEQSTEIVDFVKSGKSVEDCVTYLTMIYTAQFATKTLARTLIGELLEKKNLIPTKKVSKSQGLKDWFLSQEDPTAVTPEQVKKQCEELEMKGGSVQYYINSYKLAIDLFGQINK